MYICLGKALNSDIFYCKKAKSLMVRTPGFHPEGPGSIPHAGFFFNFNSHTYFQSSANSLSAAYYSFQHSVLSSYGKKDLAVRRHFLGSPRLVILLNQTWGWMGEN